MSDSIEQRAVNYAADRSQGAGHGYPSFEARLIEKGYVKGAKDQANLMFSNEEVIELLKTHKRAVLSEEYDDGVLNDEKWFEQFRKK
jgi:hypothetical protein